jgi:hypothetical protein
VFRGPVTNPGGPPPGVKDCLGPSGGRDVRSCGVELGKTSAGREGRGSQLADVREGSGGLGGQGAPPGEATGTGTAVGGVGGGIGGLPLAVPVGLPPAEPVAGVGGLLPAAPAPARVPGGLEAPEDKVPTVPGPGTVVGKVGLGREDGGGVPPPVPASPAGPGGLGQLPVAPVAPDRSRRPVEAGGGRWRSSPP